MEFHWLDTLEEIIASVVYWIPLAAWLVTLVSHPSGFWPTGFHSIRLHYIQLYSYRAIVWLFFTDLSYLILFSSILSYTIYTILFYFILFYSIQSNQTQPTPTQSYPTQSSKSSSIYSRKKRRIENVRSYVQFKQKNELNEILNNKFMVKISSALTHKNQWSIGN